MSHTKMNLLELDLCMNGHLRAHTQTDTHSVACCMLRLFIMPVSRTVHARAISSEVFVSIYQSARAACVRNPRLDPSNHDVKWVAKTTTNTYPLSALCHMPQSPIIHD